MVTAIWAAQMPKDLTAQSKHSPVTAASDHGATAQGEKWVN
jgi:hypothetical protein